MAFAAYYPMIFTSSIAPAITFSIAPVTFSPVTSASTVALISSALSYSTSLTIKSIIIVDQLA